MVEAVKALTAQTWADAAQHALRAYAGQQQRTAQGGFVGESPAELW